MAAVYVNERENSFFEIMKICGTFVSKNTRSLFNKDLQLLVSIVFLIIWQIFKKIIFCCLPQLKEIQNTSKKNSKSSSTDI